MPLTALSLSATAVIDYQAGGKLGFRYAEVMVVWD
jgi:hypothetical protein